MTGIERRYLTGNFPIEQASVTKRMSWAASQETRREDDIAYSLIGLFDVSMSLLHGEGVTRAFLRLQEEMMKISEDQSLFAWVKGCDGNETRESYHWLLADSSSDFERTSHDILYTEPGKFNSSAMTARGRNITLPLRSKEGGTVIAPLHCPVPSRGYNDWLAVYLKTLRIAID